MTQPLVSAVTIVRDGERFLAEAIESALDQTYRNLELIVVDDGSTDRSAEIAERFARAEPGRVRLVRHADGGSRGMSAARTLGGGAHGALIGFLDADDVAPRQDRRASRRPRRLPGRGHGLRPHADVVQLGREPGAQRLLLRPRRRARPALPAPPAPAAAAREPRPVADAVQRSHPPRGVRRGWRVRGGVLRPLRGPGLREAVPALGDLRLEPALGALPPARGERGEPRRFSYARYYRDGVRSSSGLRGISPTSRSTPTAPPCLRRSLAGAASLPRRPRGTAAAGCAAGGAEPTRLGGTVSVIVAFRDAGATSRRRSRASRRRSTTVSS